jgi:aminopeptidase-like protein
VKHSNSADVEAELVDVGTGVGEESYKDKDVRGKIVLATAYTGTVMREAVLKRGALGVVTWYPPEVRPGYPNMIRYTAIWPTWEEKEKIGFGFNVSKIQGWQLKRMLDDGRKVVLKADVEAEYYDTKVEVLSASLPGSVEPEKEVMIIGHLCHPLPSANDNASGSGGMLEMARALKRMIDEGLVEAPKRTIRFLWVPEFAGTVPYIKAHLERTRNTLAVINCDMIGEDLHLTGGTFNVTCTPDSLPSYLNDVVVNFTRLADGLNLRSVNGSNHPFAYRIRPFGGGSDHYIFNDGALSVPSVMFGHGDTFHHTSLDTPDKVDPSELRRVCLIALGSTYYMANAAEKEAKDMALLITRNGISRISQDYYDSLSLMHGAEDAKKLHSAYQQVLNVVEHSLQREIQAVLSTSVFIKDVNTRREIQAYTQNMSALGNNFKTEAQKFYSSLCRALGTKPKQITLTADEKRLQRIIPVRSEDFVCPLQSEYVEEKLGQGALRQVRLRGYTTYEAVNFADGKRSLYDIARAVSAEFEPVAAKDVETFFQILEKAGLFKLKTL